MNSVSSKKVEISPIVVEKYQTIKVETYSFR